MSKKIALSVIACFILGMTWYFAWDPTGDITQVNEFLELYLHTPQRYLYIVSLYVFPTLYFTKVPFQRVEYRVRLGATLFSFLVGKAVRFSFCLSLFVFLVNLFVPLAFGLTFVFSSYLIAVFSTLFTYVFCCVMVYNTAYFYCEKELLSLIGVAGVNLMLLAVIYAFNFYVVLDGDPNRRSMLVFYFYISAAILYSLITLGIKAEKKECLKKKVNF